jgi:hypothetical protein
MQQLCVPVMMREIDVFQFPWCCTHVTDTSRCISLRSLSRSAQRHVAAMHVLLMRNMLACWYCVCANLQVKLEQAAAELSAANQKVDALSIELSELQATLEQVLYNMDLKHTILHCRALLVVPLRTTAIAELSLELWTTRYVLIVTFMLFLLCMCVATILVCLMPLQRTG